MIAGIRQQTCPVDDIDQTTLVSVVKIDLSCAEVWAVTRAGEERLIGRSSGTGKVDSASARYYPDGTVRLCVERRATGG